MLWESCASRSDTTWLQGEKLLESTPHSRANRGTKCLGIRLQTWPRMVNLDRVGLMYLFFMSAVWQIFSRQSNTFFSFQWDDCESASSLKVCGHCIGTDKLGHFLEHGLAYYDITKSKSEAYATAWGYWTEGLVDPGMTPQIYRWLLNGKVTFNWVGSRS